MAFIKYAKSNLVKPFINPKAWEVRTAKKSGSLDKNLITQASDIFKTPFDPDNYLLTHCTIIASVEVEEVPNTKLGSLRVEGKKIVRKYSDYHIRPDTQKWINNNDDSWSRAVLLKSYPSFIGSQNYLEHVQIPELSKGRIIDAVARDIGDSVYVDILVATDKKHKDLVESIKNGRLNTLSMGCTVDFTVCTKCGNVASDEPDMCSHIAYMKGNKYFDDLGNLRKIAELCGHSSVGPCGGVNFIEASWVGTPAFTGAVLRNVIDTQEMSGEVLKQAQEILASPPKEWVSEEKVLKTAQFDLGDEDEGEEEDSEKPEQESDPFSNLEKQIEQQVVDRVKKKLQEKLKSQQVQEALSPEDSSAHLNDNVIKQSSDQKLARYVSGLNALVRTASSDVDLINRVATYHQQVGIQIPRELYITCLKVGSFERYRSNDHFRNVCRSALGRKVSMSELNTLVKLSTLLSEWEKTVIKGV